MGRARGANAVMLAASETTYGTPPVSGYTRLPFVSSNLGAEQGLIESDLLGLGRAPADPVYDVVTNDGDVVVPLDDVAIGFWLRLLFGPPASTTDSPSTGLNTHLFKSGAQTLPSMAIEIGHPDRPAFSTNYGLRANTFAVQMRRSGLSSATVGLIGKGETVLATTSSVTSPSGANGTRFPQATGRISIDGTPLGEVVEANLSYSNQLEKDEVISPDGEISEVDPGMPMASVQLTTKFADFSLYNKATSGTPVAVQLDWSAGTKLLRLTLPRVFLPRVKRPVSGPTSIQAAFQAQASSASGVVMSATIVNEVAGAAYA